MRNVFFDLDGTLTHSHEGIARCIQHALTELGADAPSAGDLRRFIGPPLRDSFALLLDTADPARLDAALAAYRERFQRVGMFENTVCPGISDVLAGLSHAGYSLSVVTSKPAVFAKRILEHFALARYFGAVYGPDLSSSKYSKTSLIAEALAGTGARPEDAAMIGDRAEDVHGARANRVYAIAVAWGYGSRGELEDARPDRFVDTPSDLPLAVSAAKGA